MTQFEQAVEAVKNGKLNAPSVSASGKEIDYFVFQLNTHIFNLKIMSNGMKFKGIKFTDIKKYYGLKGKSAKDCINELETIKNNYEKGL